MASGTSFAEMRRVPQTRRDEHAPNAGHREKQCPN